MEKMEATQTKKTSLLEQGTWLLFAKLLGFVFSAVLPFVLVRQLSKSDFGLYKQVFLVIANIGNILPLGFGMSAYYFLPREPLRQQNVIFNILLFNFVVGGLAFLTLLFFPNLLESIFQSPQMREFAVLIGTVIWLWIFSNFLEHIAVANQEPRMAMKFIVFAQLSKTIWLLCAAFFFTTVESLIYAAMMQAAVQTAILMFYLNSRFAGFWRKFDFAFFRQQFKYSLPFGLASLLGITQIDLHNYFVGHRFTDAEFAIYANGCFELPLIGMLMESVGAILIPRMSELQRQNDRQGMIELTVKAMEKLALAYFPMYVFLLISAKDFVTTLFTNEYAESIPIFIINITLLPTLIFTTDAVVRSYAHLGKFLLRTRIFIFVGMVAALFLGIQQFDLLGMIAIVVVTSLIERTITTIKVYQTLGVKPKDWRLLNRVFKTALAAIFAGCVLFILNWFFHESCNAKIHQEAIFLLPEKLANIVAGLILLGLSGTIFGFAYCLALRFFDVLTAEDKILLRNIQNRVLQFGGRKNTIESIK